MKTNNKIPPVTSEDLTSTGLNGQTTYSKIVDLITVEMLRSGDPVGYWHGFAKGIDWIYYRESKISTALHNHYKSIDGSWGWGYQDAINGKYPNNWPRLS